MHIRINCMHRAVCLRSPDELVIVPVESTERGCNDGIRRKFFVYIFMVVNFNITCGLDGTYILPSNGRGSHPNMQGHTL